jgi:transaldolase
MPEATLHAVADHGQVPADSIHGSYAEAHQTLTDLRAVGIDYDDVMRTLEDDGVAKFDASWDQVGEHLTTALQAHAPNKNRS